MEIWTYMKQISKFMDRDENSGQVQGSLVKFTRSEICLLQEVQKFSTSSIQVEQNSYFGKKRKKRMCSVLDPVYNQELFLF